MTELITCEHLGYRQENHEILADVSWRIERGQHWAVLGPNGSGKTTLLRIACGYLWPTSGRVLRLGRDLLDLSQLRRSIGWISSGMIAQIPASETGLDTAVSGRFAQIGLKRFPGFGPTSADYAEARAELERLGCESLADKPFGILSQGERQQVLIARARMARPLLLVLDEPCAGMDPGVRERFLNWLNDRLIAAVGPAAAGATGEPPVAATPTVVLVTHHVEEIVPAVQNTLILRDGRIHAAGPTQEIVTRESMETVYGTRLARIEHSGGRIWPIWE